uniref:PH domain-containing protein n=1 Tax=Gongylonema pulchrum TaxID=637853 RepID=A0A183DFF0_9BILA
LYLECTHHLRCSEADRARWFEMRRHSMNLLQLGNIAREDGYILQFVSLCLFVV